MVFSKKMGGALADVPLFGTAFNNWFPIVVLFWCGALFLNVWQAIARFILPARLQLQDSGSNEHLERGQVLIRKEQVRFCAAATTSAAGLPAVEPPVLVTLSIIRVIQFIIVMSPCQCHLPIRCAPT